MPRGDSDHDRHPVDRNSAEAMPHDYPARPEALPDGSFEVGEDLAGDGKVGFVVEGNHPACPSHIGADPTREHHDPPKAGSRERPDCVRDRERPACEPHAHPQPPP